MEWCKGVDALGRDGDSTSEDDSSGSEDEDDFCVAVKPSAPFPPLSVQHQMNDRLGRNVYEDDESMGAEDEGTYG